MAEHLASIFGTEKDKVNCAFYHKIGACRHGDRCSRNHNRPQFSQSILFVNMYFDPSRMPGPDGTIADKATAQEHFEDFYADVHQELSKFGEVEELHVCENMCDHLAGNVYVKFADEEAADKAIKTMQGRYYDRRPVMAEYSPVTDFRESRCRQHDMGECSRGGYCNFMHLKPVPKELYRELFKPQGGKSESPERRRDYRDRSPERKRHHSSRDRDDYYNRRSPARDYRDDRRDVERRRRDHHRSDEYRRERDRSDSSRRSERDDRGRAESSRRSERDDSRRERGHSESSRRSEHDDSRREKDRSTSGDLGEPVDSAVHLQPADSRREKDVVNVAPRSD